MREIRFRGWDIQRKEWVYGYFYSFGDRAFIIEPGKPGIPEQHIEVDWSSVAQYTGLQDPEGKDIYEGGIIELCSYISEEGTKIDREVCTVVWGGPEYPAFDLDGWDHESNGLSELVGSGEWVWQVIGNIYENSEFLSPKQ